MQPIHIWLDDERNPADPLIQELFGSKGDEIWVTTAQGAIQALVDYGMQVASISLDNDLGDESAAEGYAVARYIEEMAFLGQSHVFELRVHTMNPVAREKIEASFENTRRLWDN